MLGDGRSGMSEDWVSMSDGGDVEDVLTLLTCATAVSFNR